MPFHDRIGLHDDQRILPAIPAFPQDGPEKPVHSAQGWPGPFPFEDGQLLTERKYFDRRVGPAAQEDAGSGKACE